MKLKQPCVIRDASFGAEQVLFPANDVNKVCEETFEISNRQISHRQ